MGNPFPELGFGHMSEGGSGKAVGIAYTFPFRYGPLVESRETDPIRWRGKGNYDVTLRFALIDGRMECVGADIEVVQGRRPRALTAEALRALPFGSLVAKRRPEAGVTLRVGQAVAHEEALPITPVKRRRGGRPPIYGPEHWQEVARIYTEAWAKNKTPTRAVARHWGVSESAAAKWVAKCRDLGLLPKTTKGKARAGGQTKTSTRGRKRT